MWGPGGSFVGAAVDELIVQLDGEGRASWVIQDAGGDVVALAVNAVSSSGGAANGSNAVAATGVLASATGTNLSFRIAAQQEYDAYGQVIWAEHLLNHAALHLGHKGLFVDRLDVGVGNGIGTGGNGNPGAAACAKTFGEPPRIVPLAFTLAQNRNRVLHTSWGRYLQQDPNASGFSLLTNEAMNGGRVGAAVAIMQIQMLYGNGAHLYNYLGSSPMAAYDPLGLYFGEMASWDGGGRGYDPFDWVDDYIAEDAGSKAAFLNNVIGAARTTGYVLGTIAQLHPAVGIAVAAYNIGSGQGTVWDALAIVGGGGATVLAKTIGVAARTQALTAGAVKVGSRLASVAGHEWHHIIPKFLGGADNALQMLLTVEKHREFHAMLRAKLNSMTGALTGNWSQKQWLEWMGQEVGNAEKVLETLMDTCVAFDDKHGYGLVSKLVSALKAQGFANGVP